MMLTDFARRLLAARTPESPQPWCPEPFLVSYIDPHTGLLYWGPCPFCDQPDATADTVEVPAVTAPTQDASASSCPRSSPAGPGTPGTAA